MNCVNCRKRLQTDESLFDEEATTLFRQLTDEKCMEQPLCIDCVNLYHNSIKIEKKNLEADNERYHQVLEGLNCNFPIGVTPDPDLPNTLPLTSEELEFEIEELGNEVKRIEDEIKEIEFERHKIANDFTELHTYYQFLTFKDIEIWQKYEEAERVCEQNRDEITSTALRHSYIKSNLDRLRQIDTIQQVFDIKSDGGTGRINGIRIAGLRSGGPLNWDDINAGWGQLAHLLQTLALKFHFTFTKFKILLNGSFTTIEDLSDNSILELYDNREITINRIFWKLRYDRALKGFLYSFYEFSEFLRESFPTFALPHKITKGKIVGDHSIARKFSSDENWAKAIMCLLINFKYVLHFTKKCKPPKRYKQQKM